MNEILNLNISRQRNWFRTTTHPVYLCSLIFFTHSKQLFQYYWRYCRLHLPLTVTSATCEWSFSSMRRTKMYLRPTMGDSTLNNVSIFSIEWNLSPSLSKDSVVETSMGQSSWEGETKVVQSLFWEACRPASYFKCSVCDYHLYLHVSNM